MGKSREGTVSEPSEKKKPKEKRKKEGGLSVWEERLGIQGEKDAFPHGKRKERGKMKTGEELSQKETRAPNGTPGWEQKRGGGLYFPYLGEK